MILCILQFENCGRKVEVKVKDNFISLNFARKVTVESMPVLLLFDMCQPMALTAVSTVIFPLKMLETYKSNYFFLLYANTSSSHLFQRETERYWIGLGLKRFNINCAIDFGILSVPLFTQQFILIF